MKSIHLEVPTGKLQKHLVLWHQNIWKPISHLNFGCIIITRVGWVSRTWRSFMMFVGRFKKDLIHHLLVNVGTSIFSCENKDFYEILSRTLSNTNRHNQHNHVQENSASNEVRLNIWSHSWSLLLSNSTDATPVTITLKNVFYHMGARDRPTHMLSIMANSLNHVI